MAEVQAESEVQTEIYEVLISLGCLVQAMCFLYQALQSDRR